MSRPKFVPCTIPRCRANATLPDLLCWSHRTAAKTGPAKRLDEHGGEPDPILDDLPPSGADASLVAALLLFGRIAARRRGEL